MKAIKILSGLGVLAMTAVLFYGFTQGDFLVQGAELLSNPWGIVSMVDLYTGFILFSIWIVFRETSFWKAVLWVILMMVLGFFTGSVYTFLAANQSKGDWQKFWMGNRSE